MINLKELEVWFVTGSQHLYGSKTLEQVTKESFSNKTRFLARTNTYILESKDPEKLKFFSLMNSDNEKKSITENPTSSDFYRFASIFYKFFGRLYFSDGYTENWTEKRTFVSGNGVSVAGPYKGSTSIEQVPELQDLVFLFEKRNV